MHNALLILFYTVILACNIFRVMMLDSVNPQPIYERLDIYRCLTYIGVVVSVVQVLSCGFSWIAAKSLAWIAIVTVCAFASGFIGFVLAGIAFHSGGSPFGLADTLIGHTNLGVFGAVPMAFLGIHLMRMLRSSRCRLEPYRSRYGRRGTVD